MSIQLYKSCPQEVAHSVRIPSNETEVTRSNLLLLFVRTCKKKKKSIKADFVVLMLIYSSSFLTILKG
jgi:hypothetical protein